MKTIAVIGGGVTGLAAMLQLQKWQQTAGSDAELVLLEAHSYLGGKIHTVENTEFIMETGADSVVSRKEGVAELLDELDLQEDLAYNATGTSYIYRDKSLYKIPEDTVFGIPMSAEALFNSELVSLEGKKAAMADFFTVNETFTIDSSIGEFLEAFLGKEMVEKQISPVLSGVYSGKLHELTLATTMPYLLDYKNKYGSIMRGLALNKEKHQSKDNKKFVSFQTGLSALINRMEERLSNVKIIKNATVEKIERQDGRYILPIQGAQSISADYVIVTAPHHIAQNLLDHSDLDQDFEQLQNSSLISVYLGFDIPDSRLPADGTGFIVPEDSDLTCNACTWTSRKWEHTSPNRTMLLRLFYKNTDTDAFGKLSSMSEEELVQTAQSDVEKSLGINEEPIAIEVTKWTGQMPKYHLRHGKIVASLSEKMELLYPGIHLAGCSYYGVGIADCLANGKETASKIIQKLS